MQRTKMKWLHMLAGMALIFLYACGGGGGGDNGPDVIFTDDFSSDSRGEYTTQDIYLVIPPIPPSPNQFNYDVVGKQLQIITADNWGLIFSRDFPAANDNGVFSFDFYPTVQHPTHGGMVVRLMQDALNFYEVAAYDWPGIPSATIDFSYFRKVVAGAEVDYEPFVNRDNYDSQIPPTLYRVTITVTPALARVEAFGETIELAVDNTPIDIVKFEIETDQQDAYYDNLELVTVP